MPRTRTRDTGTRASYYSEELYSGIPYSKEGYRGSAMLYWVEVTNTEEGWLNAMTNGGTGDVDIYLRREKYPTKMLYDDRSARNGNQEQVVIENPERGRW